MTDSINTETSKTFQDFNLHPDLLKSIEEFGYKTCTPIQERAIPLLLKGLDIAGLAQTGTGKTAAFLVPLIERVLRSIDPASTSNIPIEPTPAPIEVEPGEEADQREDREAPKAPPTREFPDWKNNNFILILVPTRELVGQVLENLEKLTKHTTLKSLFLYGGVGYDEQKDALKKPFQFIVATPGRLIDLYKEGLVDFKQVRGVVFDEADRMFDMGFQDDVFFVLRRIPTDRQLLLFSATLNFQVTEMAYQANSHPIEIDVSRDKVTTENIDDHIIHVRKDEKPKYILTILKKLAPKQVIIFTNFKNKVPRLSQFLNDNGYPSLGISSLMTQSQRNRVIESFKAENKHNIMVATDLAARGLDIKGVDLVINYELPEDAENYVHRIGRTGRAETKGNAISFVSDKDVESLVRIEEYLKEKLETMWMEDSEIIADYKPMPPDEFRRSTFDNKRPPSGRGDRPRRSGGGDRGPRRDGAGPRPGGRNDHRGPRPTGRNLAGVPTPNGEGPTPNRNAGGEKQTGSVHRDRRLGRHANSSARPERNAGSRDSGRPQNGNRPNTGSGRNNNNRPQTGRGGNQSRRSGGPGRPTPNMVAAKKTSLFGKITGAVKKIFGN